MWVAAARGGVDPSGGSSFSGAGTIGIRERTPFALFAHGVQLATLHRASQQLATLHRDQPAS
jgi:hypothetical protein